MSVIAAIIVFGLLIFFHELGHFLFAKMFGVYVEKFSIGFGPSLITRKTKETEYTISAIPLGGYVKMFGENPDEEIEDDEKKHRSFSHKPLTQRFFIVFAGPLFNFLLAFLLFSAVNMMGTPKLEPVVGSVQENMPAYSAGITEGDRIVAIDGNEIKYWSQISEYIRNNNAQPVTLEINRNGELLEITVKPTITETKNIFGEKVSVGLIGIAPANNITTIRYNPVQSVYLGLERTYEISKLTIVGIVKIFQRIVPADNIGGPILIFQMAQETASAGLNSLLMFMAVISINLAILNLLPIPILDGGHLFFYLIEALKGKPVSMRTREVTQMIGLALLLALMAFAFYNDIMRILSN